MKNAFVDNATGPTSLVSMLIAKITDPEAWFSIVPSTPQEWLIFFSTIALLCQITHWVYRFIMWVKK